MYFFLRDVGGGRVGGEGETGSSGKGEAGWGGKEEKSACNVFYKNHICQHKF